MLSERQETILQIVKENSPITGQHIANRLHVTRAALRSDLAILTMLGLIDARPKLGYFFTGNKEKTCSRGPSRISPLIPACRSL